MSGQLHRLSLPGALLARGFWLYVWSVETGDTRTVLYVGRTGDSSSINAQSPFTRLSQHLGNNKRANALRRHLKDNSIHPETCKTFDMIAYGPILPEEKAKEAHRRSRDKVAGLEKALADALREAGYNVLNDVKCRRPLDEPLWAEVRDVFSAHFPKLRALKTAAAGGNLP